MIGHCLSLNQVRRNRDEQMIHEHIPLLISHLDTISASGVREAYLYLTHHAATLPAYECRPQVKGAIRDFRYYQGAEQPFAFIVNQQSLLWYFRPPGLKLPAASVSQLQREFDEVRENPAGEITVRISTLEDAQRITARVFGS